MPIFKIHNLHQKVNENRCLTARSAILMNRL